MIEKKRLRKRRPRHNPNRSSNQSRSFSSFNNRGNNVPRTRGAIAKVLEKYIGMAQDAFSNGDRIVAEGYYQFAEHYQRVLNETAPESKVDSYVGNPKDSLTKNIHQNNQRPSRTQRAIDGKNERLDKANNYSKDQNIKKEGSDIKKEKSFTSDGIEALKPFEVQ